MGSELQALYANNHGEVVDKWSLYFSEYEEVLKEYRNKPIKFLEIGVQNGGTLDIWSNYFPLAKR